MSILEELKQRADDKCELCGSTEGLEAYEVAPSDGSAEQSVLICGTCKSQIENPESLDSEHFRGLSDSMWSEHLSVQVLTYRLYKALGIHDQAEMIYFEDDARAWADAVSIGGESGGEVTKDSNGTPLSDGDTVTLIKDLDVKGAGFTAKRGTIVKNIRLTENPKHIEGKINGTTIVLVAEYMKKA